MDRGDGRLLELPQMKHGPHEEGRRASPRMAGIHRLLELWERRSRPPHVMARTETIPVCLHYDDLHRVVRLGILQAVLDVPHHWRVLSIRLLRTVEDDPGDGPVLLV